MNQQEIIALQRRIGATPDGFWGPRSTQAAKDYLLNLMPSPHPFPRQGTQDFIDFYGPHGVPNGYSPPTKTIRLPFKLYLYGEISQPITQLHPHEKCADSLLRVFERLLSAYPQESDRGLAGIITYDGLYNPRQMRGGSSWSMHSWACAIDLDAGNNGNSDHWPTRSKMPIEVMECFAAEGWLSAGAFWSRDGMHSQATSP